MKNTGKIVLRARHLRLQYQAKLGRAVTMQEVATATGISQAALNNIELGKTERIDFGTLAKLCAFYGVSVGEILGYESCDSNEIRGLELVPMAACH